MANLICLFVASLLLVLCSSTFIDNLFQRPQMQRATEKKLKDPKNLRTIGGRKVDITEVPYQVGLHITVDPYRASACGGSLISHQHVLTAAHCCEFENRLVEKVVVILGSNYLQLGGHGLRRTAEAIFVHPEYNDYTLRNDIAVLMISYVDYNCRMRRVHLPADDEDLFIGRKALISGYGMTADDDHPGDHRLRAVNIITISNSECEEDMGPVADSNICSAANRRGSCNGDSGGPLVVKEGKRNILIGLTSYGGPSCEADLPSVFVRVNSYLDWIYSITTATDFNNVTMKKYSLNDN